MTAHRHTTLTCDAACCRREFTAPGVGYQARAAAVKARWSIESKGDFCPDHRTRASRMLITDTEGRTA